MKKFAIAALLAAMSTSAIAADLFVAKDYKEMILSLDAQDGDAVNLTVQDARYRGRQRRTVISIKEVSANLFVVDQNTLYYAAVVTDPSLPEKTLRDSASVLINTANRKQVRILVPANLEVSARPLPNPNSLTCLAYWSGFVYDEQSDSCVETGASGCSNPFEFQTLEACEVGNLLK